MTMGKAALEVEERTKIKTGVPGLLCWVARSWLNLPCDVCVLQPLPGETALRHLALQVCSTGPSLCTQQRSCSGLGQGKQVGRDWL